VTGPDPEISLIPADFCPDCGGELRRSKLYPHGTDPDGVVRKAMVCEEQELSFGLASDGTWSIAVTPFNLTFAADHLNRGTEGPPTEPA
jgi:hypothetical protein